MIQAGHFHVERSIFKYAKKPFSEMEAMIWLIASAGYNGNEKGRVLTGTRALSVEWGWSRAKVRRQLDLWAKSGFISLQKRAALFPGPVGDPVNRPCYVALSCNEIYLPNYSTKQAHSKSDRPCSPALFPGPVGGPVGESVLKEVKKRNKKIQSATTPPPSAPSPRVKGNQKSFEETRKIIESLDLDTFRTKYPHLNVDDEYQAFYDHFLFSNDMKSGKPNWTKWSDWNRAFHNWCNKPWKKTAPKDDDWRI